MYIGFLLIEVYLWSMNAQLMYQGTYLRDKYIFMCYIDRKVTKCSGQFKETRNLFLSFWRAETEIEYRQGNLEENLWTFKEEHVPHSKHSTPREGPGQDEDVETLFLPPSLPLLSLSRTNREKTLMNHSVQ